MSGLQISLFGPFQVNVDDQPAVGFLSDKVRALLAYLAVEQSRPFRREALAGLFWPEQPEKKARANLRRALFNLRQVIHDEDGRYLQISRQTIQFKQQSDAQIDVINFLEQLVDPEPSLAQLEKAISYINGRFLEGFSINDSIAFEEWALLNREHFQQQILDCLNRLTHYYERHNQYDEGLQFAWQQVALEPWHESGQRQLLRLLTYAGQRATAVSHFERLQRELFVELGITPETETVQLAQQIREGTFANTTKDAPPFFHDTQLTLPRPFVAREAEMKKLSDHLETAVAGQNHVVFITGEAGSGKTRLLHTFAQAAQTEKPHLIPLFGECQAQTGQVDPYLPFRAMLAQLVGHIEPLWQAGTLNRAQASRLWALRDTAVDQLINQAPDLIGTFINRAQLPAPYKNRETAVSAPPQIVLFEQLTCLLQTISQHGPLLLLLDDLQWADSGSIDLLLHLDRQLAGYPLFIIGTFRPEEVTQSGSQRHPLTRLWHTFTETYGDIEIELNQAEGRPFVDAWLDSEPNRLEESFRQTLYQQTKGHALFTIELVTEMQEKGELIRDSDGYWQVSEQVRWNRLPIRVEAVIAERMQRLPSQLDLILTTAAIQGETFLAEAVAELSNIALPEIIRQLSQVLSRSHQLVAPLGRQRIGADFVSVYRFRHNLFQTYLYDRLDSIERAVLHERTGEVLEQIYVSDAELLTAVAGQLAWHFEKGGRWQNAINYRQKAGNHALKVSANEEAVSHFREALKLLDHLPATTGHYQQELDLQLALGAALLALKGYAAPEVKDIFERARDLSSQNDSEQQLVTALFWLTSYYSVSGDLQSASSIAQQMIDITKKGGVESLYIVMAHVLKGLPLFFMGRLPQALHHFEQALSAYNPDTHREIAYIIGQDPGISSHIWASHVLFHMGDLNRAETHLETANALIGSLNHPHTAVFTLLLSGTPYNCYSPDFEKSLTYCQKALELAKKGHFFHWQTLSQFNVAYVRAQQAIIANQSDLSIFLDASISQMKVCLENEYQSGSRLGMTSRFILLADLYGRAGEIDSGFDLLAKAAEFVDKYQERYFEPELFRVKGFLHLAENDETAAEQCFHQAIKVAQGQRARLWELKATIDLCQLWQKQGKDKQIEARTCLSKLIDTFPDYSMLPTVQSARILMASLIRA